MKRLSFAYYFLTEIKKIIILHFQQFIYLMCYGCSVINEELNTNVCYQEKLQKIKEETINISDASIADSSYFWKKYCFSY